ncbi:MAG: FecR family protein [Devosia sp.]
MFSRLFPVLAGTVLMLMAAPVLAQSATGTARGVDPQASATIQNQTRQLVVGSDVFIGDRVETGDKGLVQIKFSDQTELVVGPRSALVIDDYLLRADNSIGKLSVNALAGTFRFATGTGPKDRYQISTPTGTIGVRGTEFDFVVTPENTQVLLFSGGVQMCNSAGQCAELTDTCDLGSFDTALAQVLGHPDSITGQARADLRSQFLYAVDQSGLMSEFHVQSALRCLNRPSSDDVDAYDAILGEDNPPDQYSEYPNCDFYECG